MATTVASRWIVEDALEVEYVCGPAYTSCRMIQMVSNGQFLGYGYVLQFSLMAFTSDAHRRQYHSRGRIAVLFWTN
jgi:hypothetical protein